MTDTTPFATIAHLPAPPYLDLAPDLWLTPATDLMALLIDRLVAGPGTNGAVVPTGIAAFDRTDGGLAAGSLTVLCAPLGVDRSTALVAAAVHAAEHDRRVAVYALGATLGRLGAQVASVTCGVPVRRLGVVGPTDTAMAALAGAQRRLAGMPLLLIVGQTVTSHDIRAMSLAADDPVDLLVVDNFPLLAHGGRATDLKHLAVDLNVAVLCSTTVAVSHDGLEQHSLDGDLLCAADTITWADPAGTPTAIVAAHDPTASRPDSPTAGREPTATVSST